jgi:hypothetical protein
VSCVCCLVHSTHLPLRVRTRTAPLLSHGFSPFPFAVSLLVPLCVCSHCVEQLKTKSEIPLVLPAPRWLTHGKARCGKLLVTALHVPLFSCAFCPSSAFPATSSFERRLRRQQSSHLSTTRPCERVGFFLLQKSEKTDIRRDSSGCKQ